VTPLVFAHAGHVLIDLPIYLGPVVALVVWLKLASWREKRAAKRASRQKVREPSPGPGD
jgi:hypothetical protein